jgi:hypothetical protein
MRTFSVLFTAAIAALVNAVSPVVMADGTVTLGGGAGMIVGGGRSCTLTAIGHDKRGALVGFTAAHCGGPDAQVVAEGAENLGAVGRVVAADGNLDYAVIRFDPAKVTPTAGFAGFPIAGIGVDPAQFEAACTQGAASGTSCSRVETLPDPSPGRTMPAPWQPGDDGAPVTSDGLLIGLVHSGFVLPADLLGSVPIAETQFVLFSAILNDINVKGDAGAGFTPTGG